MIPRIVCKLLITFSTAGLAVGALIGTGRPISGIWLDGLQGNIRSKEGRWYLEPDTAQAKAVLPVQPDSPLWLLPSGFLDQMDTLAASGQQRSCTVWGQLELYKAQPYIFVTMWRWLEEPNAPSYVAEPNIPDPLAIPAQVAQRLQAYQQARSVQAGLMDIQVLVDETGMLVHSGGNIYLVTTPLGLDAEAEVYRLMYCSTLEAMELAQSRAAEPLRFNVSGLQVRCKGELYLLPLRAVRWWGHGNLGL